MIEEEMGLYSITSPSLLEVFSYLYTNHSLTLSFPPLIPSLLYDNHLKLTCR